MRERERRRVSEGSRAGMGGSGGAADGGGSGAFGDCGASRVLV